LREGVETVREPRLGEAVVRATVDGLPVLVAPKPGFARSTATLGVRFGSCDLGFVPAGGGAPVRFPDGLAHFLEHKLFEGEGPGVLGAYAELGASSNAATSFRSTQYYFTTIDRFPEALDLLLSFVQKPSMTPEGVEKEKGIVEQEIRMYEDSPDWRGFFELMRALYREHPVRVPPGGTVESVRSITVEDCLRAHAAYYRPETMTLSVSGDLDPDAVLARVRGSVLPHQGAVPDRVGVEEPPGVASPSVTVRMAVSRPRGLLGFRDPVGAGLGEALLERELAGVFALELLFARSSRTYLDLYARGVVDDTFSASATVEEDFAFTVIGGETQEPERLREEVLAALARAREGGFDEEDFSRVRRRHLGAAVRRYSGPETTANAHLRDASRQLPPFALLRGIERIDRHRVEAWVREHLREDRSAFAAVLPLR
jgi:predicted Zn-dependent peptidase